VEMKRTDGRTHTKLPVTAEVGGEGGSFADPTMQVATFTGSEKRHSTPLDEGHQPGGDADAARGILRYPTESPESPTVRSRSTLRAGLVGAAAGAAAGAAVALGLMKRRG
jgi:hypothetical protein